MRILGIDPGSSRIGYGLIIKEKGKETLEKYGLIEIKTPDKNQKLFDLYHAYHKLLKEVKPDRVGVENLYFYKNTKTMLEVAQARGVIILTTLLENLPVFELNPKEVKLSVTGYGLSDKKAVEKMVKKILKLPDLKAIDDTMDAIAIALTLSVLTPLDKYQTSKNNQHK